MTDEQKPSGAEELLTNVATTIGSALGTVAAKVNEFSKVAGAEAKRQRPRAKARKKSRPAKRSKRSAKPAKRAAKSVGRKRPARKKSRR
ncbi:MAG: hypothetical protein ABSB65_00405 [Candidatus Acidiferrales bacterium]|jgi:hypothetical protein